MDAGGPTRIWRATPWFAGLLLLLAAACARRHDIPGDPLDYAPTSFSSSVAAGLRDTFGPGGAIGMLTAAEAPAEPPPPDNPWETTWRLTLSGYIDEVSLRHPSLEAAEAAVDAAHELYPQAIAHADPQFRFLNGPTLFGNSSGAHLWRLQVQQPLPAWGKRSARGRIAQEKAAAARGDASLARERLRKLAAEVYFDYALSEALRPLVEAEQRVAEEEFHGKQVRLISSVPPAAGQAEQLQLDRLELDRRRDEFHWSHQAATRHVNLLVGRAADAPLPPPAPLPPTPDLPWDEAELTAAIVAEHPAVARAVARRREAQAGVDLARAGYKPDFVLVTRFDTNADSFWLPERAFIRPQLGVNVTMPLQYERVAASVRQAEAELRQRMAEQQIVEGEVRYEVAQSLEELRKLHHHRQRLAWLASTAQRKAEAVEHAAPARLTSSSEQWQARRQWLKYETERLRAEYAWRRKIFELTGTWSAESAALDDAAPEG